MGQGRGTKPSTGGYASGSAPGYAPVLGEAFGRVVIDTSQAQQAPAVMQGVAAGINRAMGSVNAGVSGTNNALDSLLGTTRGLAGAFGLAFGAQSIGQIARMAVDASELATAFARQSVAARTLAGSQRELNELLEAYERASGGAVDQATALSDVTRLQAVGFADDAEELEKFARAIRGISTAMGISQDTVTQNLILELFTQRGARLDQLGLQYDKVRQRADELQNTDRTLTQQMAYQLAVLEQAEKRYGALADSAEGQKTEVESLLAVWRDFRLELSQDIQDPVEEVAGGFRDLLDLLIRLRDLNQEMRQDANRRLGIPDLSGPISHRTSIGRVPVQSFDSEPIIQGARGVRLDWARNVSDLHKQLGRDIVEQTETYGRQRAETVARYEQTIAREAQDFATQRARQEQDLARSILDIRQDAAQREQRMAEDLARTIGQAQRDSADRLADLQADLDRRLTERRSDSAEKVAEWEEDRDKAVAERRKDSADRILELEEDFAKAREQRQRQYELSLEEAAARGDGRAVYRLQQRHELEEKEAQETHDERLADERDKLQESIDQLNEAHRERLADEAKALEKAIEQARDAHARQVADEKAALDKRIAQANEAYQRQLEDARAADEERIADMQADFEERKRREDEDRATRLQRMAQDHQESLSTLDRERAERLAQIKRHAAEERAELDQQAKDDLLALGVRNAEWLAEQARKEAELEALWNKFMEHVAGTVTNGPVQGPGANPVLDARRNQLRASIDERRAAQELAVPGSPEWSRLANEIIELQRALDALEAGGAASMAGIAAASRYVVPQQAMAATGSGGGINVSIASMVLQGAPTNDAAGFAQDFERQLLTLLRRVKGQG